VNENRLREIVATVAEGKVVHRVDVVWLVPQARVWFEIVKELAETGDPKAIAALR
jgi:hypothetical protein